MSITTTSWAKKYTGAAMGRAAGSPLVLCRE